MVDTNPLEGHREAHRSEAGQAQRAVVPSIDEVFDLADAIAQLGPLMPDAVTQGNASDAGAVCGGTLGPRPGELTAHQPE